MAASAETFPSGGASLPLDVFMPTVAGKTPFVLVLHGGFGIGPEYGAGILPFAEAPTENGVDAAIPHCRDATGDGPAPTRSRDRAVAFFGAVLRGS
jgi:dienelactone hydrolase